MFGFLKNIYNKKKNKNKNIVVIIDEDFYPNSENPHLENPFDETWKGEKLKDMINQDIFLTNKEKYYKFYNKVREDYRKVKASTKYHKDLISLFKDHNLTIINLGIDECFEKIGFKNVLHPKGVNSQLICSPSTFGCGKKFRFKEFNNKTICKSCKKKEHLKPNIDWLNESTDFEEWNLSKKTCEEADMILFFGSNCNRTIVNTLLNLNSESIKVEIAKKTSDRLETEFHYVVISMNAPEGIKKLEQLLPRYFNKV